MLELHQELIALNLVPSYTYSILLRSIKMAQSVQLTAPNGLKYEQPTGNTTSRNAGYRLLIVLQDSSSTTNLFQQSQEELLKPSTLLMNQ